jgi:hypothetical protein
LNKAVIDRKVDGLDRLKPIPSPGFTAQEDGAKIRDDHFITLSYFRVHSSPKLGIGAARFRRHAD